jgi:hypothetical protein
MTIFRQFKYNGGAYVCQDNSISRRNNSPKAKTAVSVITLEFRPILDKGV